MITVKQLVSDVELSLNGGTISDDSNLEKSQIKFWLSYYLNQIVATEVNSKNQRGESVPSVYVKRTEIEVAEAETEDDVDSEDERIFLDLDVEILDCNKDAGVVLVQTDEGDEVRPITIQTLQQFKHLRFSKPSLENLLYYRHGDKIFIEGFRPVDIPFNKLFVFYVPKQNLLEMEDDDEVAVSALVVPELINKVVQQGKLMLYGTQVDDSNNGEDTKKIQYHTAIKSPE